MRRSFEIAGRPIGQGQRCFFIAEAGVNHNGDVNRALQLVDIASASGADAVKFQTFKADRLATREAPKAQYQVQNTGSAESQYDMLRQLELPFDAYVAIAARCKERDIIFLSTPFDEEDADLLERIEVAAYKTPSGELTNLPYLRYIASKGKPMIVSTGMATLSEVEDAVLAIRSAGCADFAILHCVSNYPAEPAGINLRAMDTLCRAFGAPVGYSDHSEGIEIALAAVALGASVLEKHFTTDRRLPGPDHRASLETNELAGLLRGIRSVEAALGDGVKTPLRSELATAAAARKSLVLAIDVEAGEMITDAHLSAKRPGTGLSLKYRTLVVGRRARAAIPAGTLLSWEMLA